MLINFLIDEIGSEESQELIMTLKSDERVIDMRLIDLGICAAVDVESKNDLKQFIKDYSGYSIRVEK